MDNDLMIERYLDGSMSPEEEQHFLAHAKADPEMQKLLEAERVVQEVARREALSRAVRLQKMPSPRLFAMLQRTRPVVRMAPALRFVMGLAFLAAAGFFITSRKSDAPVAPPVPVQVATPASVPATPSVAPSTQAAELSQDSEQVAPAPKHIQSQPKQIAAHPSHHPLRDLDEGLNKPPIFWKDSNAQAKVKTN